MKRIAKDYDGSLAALGYEEIKTSAPLIQYLETDWVFLKRLESQLGTYLLPDCKSHRANIYLGAHLGYQHEEEMIHYKIEKEYGNYLSLNESSRNHVSNEYVNYVAEMEGNYEMGDKISCQDRVFTIIEKITELKRNTIHFTYRLQLEVTIQLPILYNEAMKGMSIVGTVISVEGDKLKLHLSIDEEQKESEAYAYPFATPYTASGNTGFYFMPQKGERVKLYFPTREEGNTYEMNAIRLDGEDNPFTEDPADKYIGTSVDKLFLMKQDEFTINAEKNELYIRMTDDDGISIISNTDMKIVSGRKVELNGGANYRGTGYLHMTHDYTYKAFAEDYGDILIYLNGFSYVKFYNPWESAGFFWSRYKKVNQVADKGETEEVLLEVSIKENGKDKNGLPNAWEERKKAYNIVKAKI